MCFCPISTLKRLVGSILVLSCLLFLPPFQKDLDAGSYSPEQVKVAMLIKFTDFITWPEEAFLLEKLSI